MTTQIQCKQLSRRRIASYIRLIDAFQAQTFRKINPYFIGQGRAIVRNFLRFDVTADPSVILEEIADWDRHRQQLFDILADNTEPAFVAGVNFAKATTANINITNIEINREVERYIAEAVATDVARITDTTRKQIRIAMLEGLSAGETRNDIAKRIRQVMTTASTSRALAIADTESHNAISSGSFNTALISGLGTKTWNTVGDESVRDIHSILNGSTIAMNKFFSNNLLYPGDAAHGSARDIVRCRCFLTYNDTNVQT